MRRPWAARPHYRVDERGFWAVETASARGVERDAAARTAWLARAPTPQLSAPNRAALARIGELADRHGFDVLMLNAPVYRGVAESPSYQRYRHGLGRLLSELASRHARLHYVHREFRFEREQMQNSDHLLAEGAARYTRAVAAELARLPAGDQLAQRRR